MPESEPTPNSNPEMSPEQEEHYLAQAQRIRESFERGDVAALDDEVINLGLELGLKGFDIERAKGILKEDCLGPEEVKQALGIEIDPNGVPPIPFSKEELERAKGLNQFLILRIDKDNEGKPLTMQRINELAQPRFDAENKGKLLYKVDWYASEPFYTQETSSLSWALVSKEIIPDSTNKNYLDQTELLIEYLKTQVFQNKPLPTEYQEAIKEFEKQKPSIAKIIGSSKEPEWKKAAQKLESLKITQLLRRSPVETIYDSTVYFQTTGQRILLNRYDWTSCRDSSGSLVSVGSFYAAGASVHGWYPGHVYDSLGVSLSRSL